MSDHVSDGSGDGVSEVSDGLPNPHGSRQHRASHAADYHAVPLYPSRVSLNAAHNRAHDKALMNAARRS